MKQDASRTQDKGATVQDLIRCAQALDVSVSDLYRAARLHRQGFAVG